MKKLFFRFDFSPKIKKFLTTLHNTQEQAILWIIRQLLPFLFPRHCPLCGKLLPYGSFIHEECHRDQNRRGLADFFCHELCRYRLSQLRDLGADAVIPVPIHKNKYKKRGYNQATLLSSRLALTLNLPHYPDMLIRSVDTLPQKQFNPQARLNNLKKAFCFNSHYDKLLSQSTPFSVLLVDDIYTSGATMEACTRILLEAGISEVYILSICIGIARD